jgi:hypothetical protein
MKCYNKINSEQMPMISVLKNAKAILQRGSSEGGRNNNCNIKSNLRM